MSKDILFFADYIVRTVTKSCVMIKGEGMVLDIAPRA